MMLVQKYFFKVWLVIVVLLSMSVNVYAESLNGDSKNRDKDFVEIVLEEGVKLDLDKILLDASKNGYKYVVEIVLEEGANVNASDKYGATALILASLKGHEEITELLINKGADVNSFTKTFRVGALMLASEKGYKKIVKLLLKNGANFSTIDSFGNTAVTYAAMNDHKEIVKILRQAQAQKK